MKKLHPAFSSVVLGLCVAAVPAAAEAPRLDENGCRVLSPLPPVGVHPRVFFTADEIPRIRSRYEASRFGAEFKRAVDDTVRRAPTVWGELAAPDQGEPGLAQIGKNFRSDEGRNVRWAVASLYGVMYDDRELKELMIGVITNYARIILASRELAVGGALKDRAGTELNKVFRIWEHDRFDVSVSWALGGAGFALSYDVLFNDMSPAQRAVVRRAIAVGTKGRKGYGTGMPRGFASSNHYGYHGDLAVMLCAIEGEEGYDRATFDGIRQVLRDYWDVGFTRNGACREDGYGPNLGMRAGGRGFLALARRGDNIFATEKYRRFMSWMALEYEPFPGGSFIGGASGGPYERLYQTSTLEMRYMYPDNPVANYVHRHMFGDDYLNGMRWQGWLDCLIWGGDWRGPASREEMLAASGLPKSVFYPVRGKLVSRSDWSVDALQFTLDARPDAFLIGHDSVDRGNFILSALGRVWASSGDFHKWNTADEHSLVHIDGKAQAWKAPSVKFLDHEISDEAAVGVADLKYAYDWEWSPPWPKVDQKFSAEWVEERADPRDLGWPGELAPDWLPAEIFGSDTGYAHPNGLRRRPFNPVRQALRATVAMHGAQPWVMIVDEIQKDGGAHLYEWYMQIPTDLGMERRDGRDVILAEAEGRRKLLVRLVRADAVDGITPAEVDVRIEDYVVAEDKKSGTQTQGKRLIISQRAVAPHFRVLLFPFRGGTPLPEVSLLDGEREGYTISAGPLTRTLLLSPDDQRGIRVEIR